MPVNVTQATVAYHLLQHHPSFVYFVFGSSPHHHGARWVCDVPSGRLTKRIRIAIPNATSRTVSIELRAVPQLDGESAHIKKQRAAGKQPSHLGFQALAANLQDALEQQPPAPRARKSSLPTAAAAAAAAAELSSVWCVQIAPNAVAQVDLVPHYHSSTPFVVQAFVDQCLCYEWSSVVLHQNNNQHKHLRPDHRIPTVCRVEHVGSTVSLPLMPMPAPPPPLLAALPDSSDSLYFSSPLSSSLDELFGLCGSPVTQSDDEEREIQLVLESLGVKRSRDQFEHATAMPAPPPPLPLDLCGHQSKRQATESKLSFASACMLADATLLPQAGSDDYLADLFGLGFLDDSPAAYHQLPQWSAF